MKQLRAWLLRMIGVFSRHNQEQELADELESHLQMHIDDNIDAGMTPEQARREAIMKLGGIESTKEAYRDRKSIPFLENFLQDLRFTLRQFRRNPGFTLTAVLILALGIGASVAIFAFVDATLIKPLPYQNPSKLLDIGESNAGTRRANLSYLDYVDWKRMNRTLVSLDVYSGFGSILRTEAGPEMIIGTRVSDGFFRTLGVSPLLGRDFYAGEDVQGTPGTVLLSYAAWKTRYGGRSNVIGETMDLDGEPNTIIGVLPESYQFAPRGASEIWTTIHDQNGCEKRRSCHNLYGIGRLKDSITVQGAFADLTSIAGELAKQFPDSNRDRGATVRPLSELIVGDIRPILLSLLGGAGLLLLISCVNVSSLLLVRSESRRKELSVRCALGAAPWRLIQQFFTEGFLLSIIGGALGLLCAYWTMQLLVKLIPTDMMAELPFLHGLGLNFSVGAFAASVSLLMAFIFSATPALVVSVSNALNGLKESSRGSAGVTWRRLGSRLVIVELAIAMILLVGAGLLGKSLYRLLHVDLGFQPDHIATLRISAPDATYSKDDQEIALGRNVVSQIQSIPGTRSVGLTSDLPVGQNGNTTWFRIVGHPYSGEHNEANNRTVSAAYFTTIQATLSSGRFFADSEDDSMPRVMIINQTLAKKYFAGENPIGQKIGDTELSPKSIREIVGVVGDIRDGSLESEIWPAVYYPFNQSPNTGVSVLVRTSQSESSVMPTIVSAIHKLDPDIVTNDEITMVDRINSSPTAYLHRSTAWLVGGFAAIALLLGVVGLYGVIAYSVSQRTREIGVRLALGAQTRAIYRLILGEAGGLAAFGIGIGLLCSIAAATLMKKLLFGTPPWDLPTLALVAFVLSAAALVGGFIPARRAARVNPVETLRAE